MFRAKTEFATVSLIYVPPFSFRPSLELILLFLFRDSISVRGDIKSSGLDWSGSPFLLCTVILKGFCRCYSFSLVYIQRSSMLFLWVVILEPVLRVHTNKTFKPQFQHPPGLTFVVWQRVMFKSAKRNTVGRVGRIWYRVSLLVEDLFLEDHFMLWVTGHVIPK